MPFIDPESMQEPTRNTRSSRVIVWMFAALVACPVIVLIIYYAIEYFRGR